MAQLARGLIGFGLLLVVVGLVMLLSHRLGLGRLPGDVVVERPGFKLYAPVATSILVSLLLTLLLNLWARHK